MALPRIEVDILVNLSHSNEIVIWETFSWTRTKLVTKSALSVFLGLII